MRPPSIPPPLTINRDTDTKKQIGLKSLYNALIEYREPKTHRILISVFMCLPSRKDFPDYFSIIEKPISMNKIRERIERNQYLDEESCLEDFKLMFSNCKSFNEDDSQIYKDAVTLENILEKKRDQLKQASNNSSHDSKPSVNHANISIENNSNNTGNNNRDTTSNHLNFTTDHGNYDASSPKINHGNDDNSIAINNDTSTQQSDSTNHSKTDQQNGKEEVEANNLKVNHNHHSEASMDSNSNLSSDLLASTPVEKCSLNTRRGRNSDAPKRQLLTGYIIYASEIRKQVIDKNPNQNFGDISRLVGNEWKALPHDIRSKYDQRALIHNKRVRERVQLTNSSHLPKLTKRKLAKLAKEQMRQHHLSFSGTNDSITQSPVDSPSRSATVDSLRRTTTVDSPSKSTVDSSTQTTAIRFVEPPTKKRLSYSDTFRRYIESLQVPEEIPKERPQEALDEWLGAGIGRHESPEAALWALRDFMLQDAVTMRRNLEPYLTN